jgi:dTDP-4-amino-4,6-dideoxygalactose transaminase
LSRDGLYEKLKNHGIYARRYFYPLIADFPMYRGLPSATRANLGKASHASDQVLCLPIYPKLEIHEQEKIINAIKDEKWEC